MESESITPSLLSPYGFALSWPILQRVRDTLSFRVGSLCTAPIVRRVSLDACMAHGPACAFHSPGMFHRLVNIRYSFARHGGRVSNMLAEPSLCVLLDSRAIACYDGRMIKKPTREYARPVVVRHNKPLTKEQKAAIALVRKGKIGAGIALLMKSMKA